MLKKDLQEKAIDQWTREIPVIASRGKITDANGVVLADNNDTYTIGVKKEEEKKKQKENKKEKETGEKEYEYSSQKPTIEQLEKARQLMQSRKQV